MGHEGRAQAVVPLQSSCHLLVGQQPRCFQTRACICPMTGVHESGQGLGRCNLALAHRDGGEERVDQLCSFCLGPKRNSRVL